MQNQNTKNKNRKGHLAKLITTSFVLVAMLVQMLSFCCFAIADGALGFYDSMSKDKEIINGIGGFDKDATISELKKDFLASVNQDLIHKIEDYELRGEVGAILSFSDKSLLDFYNNSSAYAEMTFGEYRNTFAAEKIQQTLADNQSAVLARLENAGLISEVRHNYFNILDGAFVRTTYEQIEALCAFDGVERVIISNTYLPAVAVDNPVNVYDTGIFNSGDVSYTGVGTLVAILDTGCDYAHTAFTTHQVKDPAYQREYIEERLENLVAYTYGDSTFEAREVYYGNITKDKIFYGYDYADKDTDVMPFLSSHGTHVAGIIGGYDEKITGVAIDSQLAVMKVFSDYKQGAEDGDILAALEDSVILGVDAINMSLGSSCGFTREVDEEYKNEVYDKIQEAGISLIVAASNDYSSGFGGEEGNTNKTDNPDSATVGSPSTYNAAFSVASINGNKEKYMFANGDTEVFFNEAYNMSAKEYNFFEMLGVSATNQRVEYDYVTIPGYGYAINYSGLEMSGKIALVKRGDITFEEKVRYAYEAGAAAIIVYNNVFGEITMTVGNDLKIPVISITKDDGDAMAKLETGKIIFDYNNVAGPFMSDFSSWGPTPDLTLKPEITAHGGNILSAIAGGEYEEQSGTSMAAPNMCGIAVLIRQYIKEKYPTLTTTQVRDLVSQLCMSTATIAIDKKGNPYSPRKQGAGIADIKKATTTDAYLYVLDAAGNDIGKTKLELGDDPKRTGVYEMTVNLKNLSTTASVSYKLGDITMTETVSTSEPEYVAEMAYLLSNTTEYKVEGGTLENGIVTVAAGQTAKITATIKLSDKDKAYINETFENGMFVEGFLTFDNVNESGVDLNAPFLAFFGDWGEAPIFDLDYYEVETEAHNNAIDEDDKIKADYYATTPLGTYYYDYILPLGSYLYKIDESEYSAIPATREHAAVSYYRDSISGIYGVFAGLLRGAKEMNISIVDTATGKKVWGMTEYNCYKSHYSGAPRPYASKFNLDMVNYDTNEIFGSNNAHYEVTMTAKLDWDSENRNASDTYSFSFYIDYEAPTVTDAKFYTKWDKTKEENRYFVDIMVYDNHYAMSVRPVLVYEYTDPNDIDETTGKPKLKKTFSSLVEYPVPVYQENRGEATKVTLEITDYLDIITNSTDPEGICLYIDDYALNSNIAFIPFPGTENEELEFTEEVKSGISLDINQTLDLTTYLTIKDTTETLIPEYFTSLNWTSSNPEVVAISKGKIEALKPGTATISVLGNTWSAPKSITVTVSDKVITDNPESADNVTIDSLKFTRYDTLFAFNSDIDYSEIGVTDSIHYFGKNPSISFYPSEKVQLYYELEPWNINPERYELKWTSSNPRVATVDENGVITAESEGNARITLQVIIDGKTSLIAARCSIEVKSEFIIENRTLVAYKGKGGDVVIPDDEGIMTIGAFAFCHYYFDSDYPVEKDEDGYYDIDEKKFALSNNTVTSVVIPDDVQTIEKYAFHACTELVSVTLPAREDTNLVIKENAFKDCEKLKNVNFDKVNMISDYAFQNCVSLDCAELGGANLADVYAIGKYAFQGANFDSVKLSTLSLSGEGAFKDCSRLTSVELGPKTRVSNSMFENTPVVNVVVYSDIVGDAAFKGCEALKTIEFKNTLTYVGKEAFANCEKLNSVVFGAGCEEISDSAFAGCSALKTFNLPNSDVRLGNSVFYNSGITTLKFAENTVISATGIGVFEKVGSLAIDVSASKNYKVETNAVYTKDGTSLIFLVPKSSTVTFTVPASVKHIEDGAFSANPYIISVNFATGSALESIGYAAFAGCTSLMSVTLPATNVTIDGYAFFGNDKLNSINLNKVTAVGDYAFSGTAIKNVTLEEDRVRIGYRAFFECTALESAVLGKAAFIDGYAFAASGLKSVEFLGVIETTVDGKTVVDGVTVNDWAFAACTNLTSVDFADIYGRLGSFAFYYCVYLPGADIPNVTEIGDAAFADCYSLVTVNAPNLVSVGIRAFSFNSKDAQSGSAVETFIAPKLEKIGREAFYACFNLEAVDLTNVTELGEGAFQLCVALESVTVSNKLTDLSGYAFYGCTSLKNLDLSGVVSIGEGAVFGVQLPAHLELTNVEYIADYGMTEGTDSNNNPLNYIESVNAPKLKELGAQAFSGCQKLNTFNAPNLEKIGYAAFASTAIEEFGISEKLSEIEEGAFIGSEKLKAFFATVNGEKVYNAEFADVMINNGVLYSVNPKGYMLVAYPTAKTDKEYTVADNTVRIEFGAVMDNMSIERVILPESMKYIANFAFYGAENLNTVVFKSYYAPVIEGSWSGTSIEITPETIDQYPGFDKLYKYSFYYRTEEFIAKPLYYRNFIDIVTSEAASGLTYVIPVNSDGYDSLLYKAYFNPSETENSGTVMGPKAIAFIEAVKKLPEVADRFDAALIEAAINAYNALMADNVEKETVDASFITKFKKARSEYNVSVVENKINHLFDMYNNKYSFDILKDARASYLALSEEERALVSNAAVIEAKIQQLAAAMGKTPDFSLTYEAHFPEEEPTPDPVPETENDSWKVIVIVCASVAGVAIIGVGVFFFLKKKGILDRLMKKEQSKEENSCEENTREENTCEENTCEENSCDAASNDENSDDGASDTQTEED